tara:strand:+ start:1410 stop:2396 length:987 start_codon:yes stop_codon:yes gene_type:complete
MAVPTNTNYTFASGSGATRLSSIREDLSDIIYNIAPLDTPFMSGCGKATADNTYFEWQTDTIAAGSANQQIEGDDASADARAVPTRVGNYTQISRYVVQTSGTNEAVNNAGFKSAQAYQLAKKAKQLKRDMEYQLTRNEAQNGGAAGTARKTGGLSTWLATNWVSGNPSSGSPAAGGSGTSAPTDASATASITEAMLREVIKDTYEAGGEPDMIMCKPAIKQAISDLSQSVSSLRTAADKVAPAHVVAAVDVYVSDFGTFQIVPNRNQFRDQDLFVLDMDFFEVAYLRPFKTETLAKTGDSIQQMLIVEYGLKVNNESSSGFLADIKA